jgi:ubiquinone/menaquinone biosynthesis C-methylase UbiE
MTIPSGSQSGEQPSTYFVQDRSNQEELQRLSVQDQLITAAMRGVLPEQPDRARFRRVLDVGCGTGGWLIEMAKACPTCQQLVGIDISKRMIEYAREQAYHARQDHVEFHVMDALLILAFPSGYFDLVNLRFGSSFVRTWEWPKLLLEMLRVCHPDGIVRLTEPAIPVQSSSSAYLQFCTFVQYAFFRAGYYFENTPTSMTDHLAPLLAQYGGRAIQTRAHTLHFRAGTPEGQSCIDDITYSFRTLLPFLTKWGCAPSEYNVLYQQALEEIQSPSFETTWELLTAWGFRWSKKDITLYEGKR